MNSVSKKLLFYCHGLVGGGAERLWALLASGLKERGHEVHVAVDFEASQNRGFLHPAIPVHVLGRNHLRAVIGLRALLRELNPDTAFSALGASNLKLLAAGMLGPWNGRMVQSYHGRFETEQRLLGRASYRLTALSSRLCFRTIAVSDDLRTYLIARFGASAARTLTIHNAVHVPAMPPVTDRQTLMTRPETIIAIGRLVPEKGMADLIEALARLPASVRLLILGEGPERQRLRAHIARLGLDHRVELRGYVENPLPVFAEARLLALASHTEAFGNVVVEALGQGLPVVATACGGPVEILDHGRFGRLVPPGDIEGLAAAIAATLANPGEPQHHHQRARAFALEVALDRYEALINTR